MVPRTGGIRDRCPSHPSRLLSIKGAAAVLRAPPERLRFSIQISNGSPQPLPVGISFWLLAFVILSFWPLQKVLNCKLELERRLPSQSRALSFQIIFFLNGPVHQLHNCRGWTNPPFSLTLCLSLTWTRPLDTWTPPLKAGPSQKPGEESHHFSVGNP